VEWRLEVNRELAAQYEVSVGLIGNFVKLVTNGIKASTYRPDDADDEIDIMLRFPPEYRNLDQLDSLRVTTDKGSVPIGNFVTRQPQPRVSTLHRIDGQRVITIKADVAEGEQVDKKVRQLVAWFEKNPPDPRVTATFRGEDEDQKESQTFLSTAFLIALFGIALVLVIEFNSIYDTFVVMTAIFFSTVGVLLGLMITAQPFGIVMCGLAIIVLAWVVVSNNIIFIDTYNLLKKEGYGVIEALQLTGAQRFRPILLTVGTTVLGLIPMVFAMNIDFLGREVTFDAPSSQWWTQLSTAIAGGLSFATVLTLFFTPCFLLMGYKVGQWRTRRRERKNLRKF
jgi:multidrug efflux pump